MKKIVVLNGSPRKAGSSRYLAELAAGALGEKGAEAKIFDLGGTGDGIALNPCRGCNGCKSEKSAGHCVIKDGISEIIDEMRSCDGILLAVPLYFGRFTAPCHLFLHRTYSMMGAPGGAAAPYFEPNDNRKMGTIVTCGGSPAEVCKTEADYFFGCLQRAFGIKEQKLLVASGLHGKDDIPAHQDYVSGAKDLGAWLAG